VRNEPAVPNPDPLDVWEVERDRFGVMFTGPLEVGECIRVVPADRAQAIELAAVDVLNTLVAYDQDVSLGWLKNRLREVLDA
jgi:hypothetical protein